MGTKPFSRRRRPSPSRFDSTGNRWPNSWMNDPPWRLAGEPVRRASSFRSKTFQQHGVDVAIDAAEVRTDFARVEDRKCDAAKPRKIGGDEGRISARALRRATGRKSAMAGVARLG